MKKTLCILVGVLFGFQVFGVTHNLINVKDSNYSFSGVSKAANAQLPTKYCAAAASILKKNYGVSQNQCQTAIPKYITPCLNHYKRSFPMKAHFANWFKLVTQCIGKSYTKALGNTRKQSRV